MANRITYGLSQAVVWPITATAADGTPTYGTKIPLLGATSITLDPAGESVDIYADNGVWFSVGSVNNGYTGSFNGYTLPDEFRQNILKETKDSHDVWIETNNQLPAEFALGFQVEGDETASRRIFYRCSSGRMNQGSTTQEESIEPNEFSINLTVMPRLNDGRVKATCASDSDAYATFFGTTPYEGN